MLAVVLSFLCCFAAVSPQAAEPQGHTTPWTLDDTKAFLLKQRLSPAYRAAIEGAAASYEAAATEKCLNVSVDHKAEQVRVRILLPLQVDSEGRAVGGRWRETLPGLACGKPRLYTVQVDVTPRGLKFTPTFPGQAAGDLALQRDTFLSIERTLPLLGYPGKSCPPRVLNTQAIDAGATKQEDGTLSAWREKWVVQACDKRLAVPVTYTPDGPGTHVFIDVTAIAPE